MIQETNLYTTFAQRWQQRDPLIGPISRVLTDKTGKLFGLDNEKALELRIGIRDYFISGMAAHLSELEQLRNGNATGETDERLWHESASRRLQMQLDDSGLGQAVVPVLDRFYSWATTLLDLEDNKPRPNEEDVEKLFESHRVGAGLER